MTIRRSALLSVPRERADGIADGSITVLLSRRCLVKTRIPVFIFPRGSPTADSYIRLGNRRVVDRADVLTVSGSGLSREELDVLFRRRTVYSYDIVEYTSLEHPVSVKDFDVPEPRPFVYSEVPLEEVLA